jgi:hypothetical protein
VKALSAVYIAKYTFKVYDPVYPENGFEILSYPEIVKKYIVLEVIQRETIYLRLLQP